VIIKVNGKIYSEVSLNEDKDIEIYLGDGAHSNTVQIKDRQAYMIYANCPDGLCLQHKPIETQSSFRDIIVCLPNGVTVEIKSDKEKEKNKEKNKFDAVMP